MDFNYIGNYKIIDGHTTLYGSMYNKDPKVRERMLFPVTTSDELVTYMKNHGVERFITFPPDSIISDIVYDPTYHIPNTQIAEAQKKYPENIIGFGRVQPNYRDKAEKEARRCFEELGLKGLKVQPETDFISMSDTERWEPIMELLAKYKYPLIAHSSIHWATNSPGRFNKLAETFPDVNIIMSHSSFRHFYDALVVTKRNDNVYLGIQFINNMRIQMTINEGVGDRLIYESDAPHLMPNLVIAKVAYAPGLTEQQKIDILGGNLARLLRLDD